MEHDPYLLFADFQSYVDCQDRVSESVLGQKQMGKDVGFKHHPDGEIFL